MSALSGPNGTRRAKIAGTGAYLPGEPVDNKRLAEFFGRDIVRVSEMLGGVSRHLALDVETRRLRPGESNANMAYQASLQALDNAGLTPDAVDLLILSTATPDYPFPATALFVQDRLGLAECQVMELRAGCGGMAQAFAVAEQFIASGRSRTALLVGSELISPFHQLLSQGANQDKGHLVATAMFGDGAGAAVLVPADDERTGVLGCMFRSIGGGRAPGMVLKAGGALSPAGMDDFGEGPAFVHDFRAILERGPELVERSLEWVWGSGFAPVDEITYYVPPQASGHLIGSMTARTDLHGAKSFSNFERVGNTASASIYIALDEMNRDKLVRPGDVIALLPAEATKWTYGGIVLRW
ncbi:MAG TPA: ketoacyl-ACP synthase III [Candidatus Bathyarchaeia archaeon]|nr:ketoacyl-ACP synthase III [Candidatus Bathyarchaeia archaeon]